ncbi:MAG: glycosyltransferase family 39 protein [Bacteroidota bacterium]
MNKTHSFILKSFELTNPHLLRNILFLAVVVRMVAVIFAKGFGMLDDHFLVIEASQSWVDGTDYNNWLPKSGATVPDGHSFFYSGIHFILFTILKFLGITDPQNKMLIIRFLHAAFSLLTVVFGFKIAKQLGGVKAARMVGFLLGLYWFMPWLSVRNLIEVTCVPFMMWGSYLYLKATTQQGSWWRFFVSGLVIGLAVDIRFQVLFYVIGFGLGMLMMKQWKAALMWSAGVVVSFCVIQVFVDLGIWGYAFAQFIEYIKYNLNNAYHYIQNAWYSYLLLVLGILLPPMCFFWFFGFLRSYKLQLAMFAGTLLFFVFHSYFPNKQERFILPIVPMLITLGVVGWLQFYDKSKFWERHRKLMRLCLIIFWTLNLLLLPVISTMYSKRARVESMYYLERYPNLKCLCLEDVYKYEPDMPPLFYLGQWVVVLNVCERYPIDSLNTKLKRWGKEWNPRFVLFFDDQDLPRRVAAMQSVLPQIEYETTIEPSFIDEVLHKMNPANTNQTVVIYRNKEFFENKR